MDDTRDMMRRRADPDHSTEARTVTARTYLGIPTNAVKFIRLMMLILTRELPVRSWELERSPTRTIGDHPTDA